jgi:hypothetical protein
MSGYGMGSNLITYYRKATESDEFSRPEKVGFPPGVLLGRQRDLTA